MNQPTQSAGAGLWRLWLAALLWGFNWPIVKIMLQTSPPWSLRAAGLSGGALVLLAACLLTRTSLRVPKDHWRNLALAGTLNIAMFNICAIFA